MDAIAQIARSARGLLFSSEADYPLEPFIWTNPAPFSPDLLYTLTNLPATTPVAGEDVHEFMAPMLAVPEGASSAARKRAARFQRLVQTLDRYLQNLTVYKLGTIEMPTFIVGTLADGTVAGLRTTVVET